ncbi:MAG: beta-phosphoglucomutase [Carnobacterium sp.]|nr:beta-phosphoglucomutase [Carnobacterium sp.]
MKAVLFDLDGIITDTAGYHFLAWKSLAKKLGMELDEEFNEQLKGVSRTDSLELILKRGQLENTVTLAEKERLAASKNEVYNQMIKQMNASDSLPGIESLLIDLKTNHFLLGLASASQNGPAILKKLGLYDLFDTIVNPAELSAGKPDPEIFQKAAEQLGCSVSECVGIEDAAADVESINRAKMVSIAVGDKEVLHAADKVIKTTNELTVDLIKTIWTECCEIN